MRDNKYQKSIAKPISGCIYLDEVKLKHIYQKMIKKRYERIDSSEIGSQLYICSKK